MRRDDMCRHATEAIQTCGVVMSRGASRYQLDKLVLTCCVRREYQSVCMHDGCGTERPVHMRDDGAAVQQSMRSFFLQCRLVDNAVCSFSSMAGP